MASVDISSQDIERLRTPWDWKDLSSESPVITRHKIERAKELGVVAVVFTASQVAERAKELALLEYALRNGDLNKSVYGVILKGGVQFASLLFREMASLSPVMNPVVDYVDVSRYGSSQQGGGIEVKRKLGPKTDINRVRFTKIEDTIDEGITMERTGEVALDPERCFMLGDGVTGPASEIGVIALTDKRISEMKGFKPESVTRGLWIPNAWGGGNGLDGPNEALRWIPETVITPVQHEKYRDAFPEILDILGERAVMGMDDITWIAD